MTGTLPSTWANRSHITALLEFIIIIIIIIIIFRVFRITRWRDMTGTLPSTGPNRSHLTALYRPNVGRSDLRVGGLQIADISILYFSEYHIR